VTSLNIDFDTHGSYGINPMFTKDSKDRMSTASRACTEFMVSQHRVKTDKTLSLTVRKRRETASSKMVKIGLHPVQGKVSIKKNIYFNGIFQNRGGGGAGPFSMPFFLIFLSFFQNILKVAQKLLIHPEM
jgi:hypothetical protein